MQSFKGKCWVFAENVDTDQILPGYAMAEKEADLGRFALAGSPIEDFSKRVEKGDMVVAGPNFGCGSSREQAPVALQLAGVSLVIAPSFARIFRRNAINIGLPVITADIWQEIKTGDTLEVDIEAAEIRCANKIFRAEPISPSSLATLEAGGLINRVRKELGVEQR